MQAMQTTQTTQTMLTTQTTQTMLTVQVQISMQTMQIDNVAGTKRSRSEMSQPEEVTPTSTCSVKRTKSNAGRVTAARMDDLNRDLLNAHSMLFIILKWIDSMDAFPFENFSVSELVAKLCNKWPALCLVIKTFARKTLYDVRGDPNASSRFHKWSILLGVIFECDVCIFSWFHSRKHKLTFCAQTCHFALGIFYNSYATDMFAAFEEDPEKTKMMMYKSGCVRRIPVKYTTARVANAMCLYDLDRGARQNGLKFDVNKWLFTRALTEQHVEFVKYVFDIYGCAVYGVETAECVQLALQGKDKAKREYCIKTMLESKMRASLLERLACNPTDPVCQEITNNECFNSALNAVWANK